MRRIFAGRQVSHSTAKLPAEERLGPHRTWRVRVAGTASFHGTASWTAEEDDRVGEGFAIEDAAPLPLAGGRSAADER